MADDSLDIEPSMDFHPCDKPHGMKDYVLSDLTQEQQSLLNIRKREQIRTDQQYLAQHPEIRGLIIMILRILMKEKPKTDIYEVIGQYFTKSSVDLKEEIYAYLDERSNILSANSTLLLVKEESLEPSFLVEEEVEEEQTIEEAEKLLDIEDMEEGKEKAEEEKEVRWDEREGSVPVEEEEAAEVPSVATSVEKMCQAVLNDLLETVFEEVDAGSLGSIASVGFPVDYEDHAYESARSSEESLI